MPSSNSRREHGNNNSRKGGGGDSSREVNISKAMSFILRHGAQREGLKLDENGYARVDELVCVLFGGGVLIWSQFVLIELGCLCVARME